MNWNHIIKRVLAFVLVIGLIGCGTEKNIENNVIDSVISEIGGDIAVVSPTVEPGTLRIAVMYLPDGGVLDKAIELYKQEFPEWQVEVTAYQDLTEIVDEIVRRDRFNLEVPQLMREGKVDLVDVDRMPVEELRKEGLLEELSMLFAEGGSVDLNTLLPSIRDIITTDGGVYSLPTTFFTYSLMWYYSFPWVRTENPPQDWTWEEMAAWFETDMERLSLKELIRETPDSFIQFLLDYNYSYFADMEKNEFNFNSPVFMEIVKVVKLFYTDKGLNNLKGLLMDMPFNGDVSDYKTMRGKDYIYFPFPTIPGAEGKSVRLDDTFAINARSPQKEAAWEFMKILLSEEVQNSLYYYAEPVIDNLSEEYVKHKVAALTASSLETKDLTPEEIVESFNNDRRAFYADINRAMPARTIRGFYPIIYEHILSYCENVIELEQCINNIQEDVEQYFQE